MCAPLAAVNAGKAASNSPRKTLSEGEIAESQKTAHIANIRPTRTKSARICAVLFWPPLFVIRDETLCLSSIGAECFLFLFGRQIRFNEIMGRCQQDCSVSVQLVRKDHGTMCFIQRL